MKKAKTGLFICIASLILCIIGLILPLPSLVNTILLYGSFPLSIVGLVSAIVGGKELKRAGEISGISIAALIVGIFTVAICGILFISCGLCELCMAAIPV